MRLARCPGDRPASEGRVDACAGRLHTARPGKSPDSRLRGGDYLKTSSAVAGWPMRRANWGLRRSIVGKLTSTASMMTNVFEPMAKAPKAPIVRAVEMSFVRAIGRGETMV